MRITGSRMLDQAAAATASNQSKLADKAGQVSSGLRVQTPSDDPSAWLAAHRAQLKKQLSEGTGVAMQFSRDRLDESDRALASVLDAVTATRALAVQGGNDSYNAANRVDLALQVRSLFESALGAANTRAPDGEYLLAGAASLAAPFDANGAYLGDAGTRQIPTSRACSPVSPRRSPDVAEASVKLMSSARPAGPSSGSFTSRLTMPGTLERFSHR